MSVINSPIPGVGEYGNLDALAQQAYQNAVIRSNQNIQSALRNYGYTANVDPKTGVLTGLGVDAHNMYGQYQQMLRGHADTYDVARNSVVGRHLGGGLAKQLLTKARYGFGNDQQQLGQNVLTAVQGHEGDLQDATYNRNSALWQAEMDALRNSIANNQFNTAGV